MNCIENLDPAKAIGEVRKLLVERTIQRFQRGGCAGSVDHLVGTAREPSVSSRPTIYPI